MIAGIGLRNRRKLTGGLPVELAGIHHDAAERRAMAADELSGGMQHDICAMLNGPDQIGRAKGVVDHKGDLMGVGDRRDGVDVRNVGIGIAQCFQIDRLGVWPNGGLHLFQVVRIHEGGLNAVERQGMRQKIIAAAVNRLLRNDVVAFLRQRLDDIGYRCRAGGKSQRAHAALQRGEALFQYILGGVCESAVDISGVRQVEAGRCVGGVVEDIGGRLVDGNGTGVGCGIGLLLPDMELQRFKFIVGHDMYLFFHHISAFITRSKPSGAGAGLIGRGGTRSSVDGAKFMRLHDLMALFRRHSTVSEIMPKQLL